MLELHEKVGLQQALEAGDLVPGIGVDHGDLLETVSDTLTVGTPESVAM